MASSTAPAISPPTARLSRYKGRLYSRLSRIGDPEKRVEEYQHDRNKDGVVDHKDVVLGEEAAKAGKGGEFINP